MPIIQLKRECNISFSEIVIPLTNSSKDESAENYVYNKEGIQQTSIYGILAPLMAINNIVVDFKDVNYFSLKSKDSMPTIEFEVQDRYGLTASLDTPGSDNVLRVQILPPFDDAYKKINLNFYINSINISNGIISGSGQYKVPELTNSQLKSFGEISTYDLFEKVAIDSKLGFASNVDNIEDKRFIYCDNISYIDLLKSEIKKSNADKTHIYDFWIDLWNNINLVDIYERYNSTDQQEDMMIWVSGQPNESLEGVKVSPIQVPAKLNNHPVDSNTQLHVDTYEIVNKQRSQVSKGTDKVYSVYMEDLQEFQDTLVMDGDVKQDVFIKYEYLGEVYGDYNYLLAEKLRDSYLQKMGVESVIVTLKTPLLGLLRGDKVDFIWYVNDDQWKDRKEGFKEWGQEDKNPATDPILDDTLSGEDQKKYNPGNGEFIIDKSISGQYMITGQDITFEDGEWFYELTLNRPASKKPQMINEELKNQ